MRTLGALVLALLVITAAGEVFAGRNVVTFSVACTTTRSHLVASRDSRQMLVVQNSAGANTVFVGRGTALFPLHAGSTATSARLPLENYQGGLDCVTVSGTAVVDVLEVIQ